MGQFSTGIRINFQPELTEKLYFELYNNNFINKECSFEIFKKHFSKEENKISFQYNEYIIWEDISNKKFLLLLFYLNESELIKTTEWVYSKKDKCKIEIFLYKPIILHFLNNKRKKFNNKVLSTTLSDMKSENTNDKIKIDYNDDKINEILSKIE